MNPPNLLLVTPSLPSPAGTGTMLRVGMSLEALSRRFRVHVLNMDMWSTKFGRLSLVHKHAVAYAEVPGRSGEADSAALAEKFFPNVEFAAIHTFRLAMARLTVGMLSRLKPPYPFLALDLDDDEWVRSQRLVKLLESQNDLDAANQLKAEQPQLRVLEKILLPRFNAICLASLADCSALALRYPKASVHHLPNAVPIPVSVSTEAGLPPSGSPAKLLFVGALNYPPNIDGICFFCEQVLPLIQAKMPVVVEVVGSDLTPRVAGLVRNPAVTIHENVPSVKPHYLGADVCVVPLRAGSGTRIKILEAFSFRRPVVSTTLGAEGLNVTGGGQLLLADDAEALANACLSVLQDPASRARMVDSAYAWVRENHSPQSVQSAIDTIYQSVLVKASSDPGLHREMGRDAG